MSTTDDGGSEPQFPPSDKWWEPGHEELRRVRYGQQVGYIRNAMANANLPLEVFPPGAGNSDVAYMYRADTIITRDDGQHSGDAERVRSILGLPNGIDKSADDLPDPIRGMRAHKLPRGRRAADALAQIEATLGPGLAGHDYLLHVSGAAAVPRQNQLSRRRAPTRLRRRTAMSSRSRRDRRRRRHWCPDLCHEPARMVAARSRRGGGTTSSSDGALQRTRDLRRRSGTDDGAERARKGVLAIQVRWRGLSRARSRRSS
jgi:hypothetical protein